MTLPGTSTLCLTGDCHWRLLSAKAGGADPTQAAIMAAIDIIPSFGICCIVSLLSLISGATIVVAPLVVSVERNIGADSNAALWIRGDRRWSGPSIISTKTRWFKTPMPVLVRDEIE
jgi:hypothetical protein